MFGAWLGIPLSLITFLVVNHYVLEEWKLVPNYQGWAVAILGASAGLFVLCLCRGIDVFLNEKRDRPAPLLSARTLPEAMGDLKSLLSESTFGPFSWSVKTVDQEAARILATISFTDFYGLLQPIQAQRLVMLQVQFDTVEESEQRPIPGTLPPENGQTRVQLAWAVDSPVNRYSANRLQDELTRSIKLKLGIPILSSDDEHRRSVFAPPQWVSAILVCALAFNVMLADQYKTFKEKQQAINEIQQRQQLESQQRAALERAQREDYLRRQQQSIEQAQDAQRLQANDLLRQQPLQQSNGADSTFTPQLGGAGNPNGSSSGSNFHYDRNGGGSNSSPWGSSSYWW